MLSNVERWVIIGELVRSLREHQGWAGETHLQKTLYFLQELLQIPLGYDFVLYKHGPYDFDLHDELGGMLSNSILALEHKPPYGPRFRVDEIGEKLIHQRKTDIELYTQRIKFIAETLSKKDIRELERLGTALLLKREFSDLDQATLASKIVQVKPHVLLNLAIDAVREVLQIEENAKAEGLISSQLG